MYAYLINIRMNEKETRVPPVVYSRILNLVNTIIPRIQFTTNGRPFPLKLYIFYCQYHRICLHSLKVHATAKVRGIDLVIFKPRNRSLEKRGK